MFFEANIMSEMRKLRASTSISPKRAMEDDEPIRLSKYSGGYPPEPNQLARIESSDWPSPAYSAVVTETRALNQNSVVEKHSRLQSDDTTESYKTLDKHKVYDDNFSDYTLSFKKYQPAVDDCDNDLQEQHRKETSLKRDLEELDKLENQSGMAKLFSVILKVIYGSPSPNSFQLLKQIKLFKAQQKFISRALNPWKASRAPSASIEPYQKTRYETPINACRRF
jgi:hypothetical protein